MNTKQLTRLLILFLLAFIWASSPAISHAQSKKKPKKQQSVDDDFDLDGDDLEKELEQLETEEIKELDAEAPAPAETPAVQEEQPAQAGDDEFLEEEEAPAPAPVAKPPSGKPVAKQKAAPEPPPPEEQPDEMIPEPSQELEEEVAKPEPIPEPAPEPVVRAEIAPVYVEDVPDEEYEARLRRIYQQFYAAAIPDEEWTGIIGDRAQEIYEVQKGDTLWGISVTFFGNGFFWPKLWQLNNSSITNPHTIEVGDKIVFSMGTLGQEPAVKVAREEDQEIIVKETETSPEPQKVIVKGRTRFNPVLEALPPSLPETSIESSKYDASGFAITAVKSPQIPDPFPILGILTDEPPAVDGQIIDVETGGNTAGMFQKVFVRLRKGGVGDIFSAFVVRKALGGG
ncbi:MAG: LysM peptidoglycan-binding domain-containing protein, partial [Bdellovibrionia bacterium]